MNIKKIKISDIKIENRLWDIDENTVLSLMESIKDIGLKTPPTVRPDNRAGQFILIAGTHRIEACARLGINDIDVIVDDVNEDYAILHEIDENLTRRAIHYAERGYQLNERKKAYERIFGAELSAQASFKRYFEDVKAIVENNKKTSRYDYTLFNEEDFNFDYIKDRVDKNQMEDLFGVYTDKNGNEQTKNLNKKDIDIAIRLYPIFKAINDNVEYLPNFKDDAKNKLNLSESTINNDLLLGKNLNADDIELIKENKLDKHLVTTIASDKNKEGYLNLIKDIGSDSNSKKGINSFFKKAISIATDEVIDTFGNKDDDCVFEKVSEIVDTTIKSNIEKGLHKFDISSLKEKIAQNKPNISSDLSNFDIEDKMNQIAELFNIDKTKIKSSIKKDKLQITIDLKEIE